MVKLFEKPVINCQGDPGFPWGVWKLLLKLSIPLGYFPFQFSTHPYCQLMTKAEQLKCPPHHFLHKVNINIKYISSLQSDHVMQSPVCFYFYWTIIKGKTWLFCYWEVTEPCLPVFADFIICSDPGKWSPTSGKCLRQLMFVFCKMLNSKPLLWVQTTPPETSHILLLFSEL